MSDQIPYLSDEEIQKLMASVEAEAPVKAPDDLEEKVIARIVSRERKKTVDFTRYCLRVGFGVAAAIALLCLVPFVSDGKIMHSVLPKELAESTGLLADGIPSRDEVLGTGVKSKEEVLKGLNEPSLFEELKSYVADKRH